MNAERLLAHYKTIADAQDAIARSRRFVLDLAVRGKLVPQKTRWQTVGIEDCLEPLSDGRLIHQGWSPQCESHPSPSEDIWGVLKTTAIQDGFYLEQQNKELPTKLDPKLILEVRAGDLLVTCAGPRARCGVACLIRETRKRLLISGKMYRFRANESIVSPDYLTLWLRADEAQAAINAMKTGSSESGLNLTQDRFRTLQVSFGDVAEQHRIVAKVDELMDLCDRLEAARGAREVVRDRLTAANLARLNAPDPETFQADARCVLDALSALTARSDQIDALRHTILNLAVRGRLVPQDPKDEPASELLKRITDKKTLWKKNKTLSATSEPFERPQGWVWTTVQNVLDETREISYGVIKLGEEPKAGGIPTLRCSDVRPGFIDLSGVRKVQETIEAEYTRTRLCGGEVVINIRGTLGGVALVPTDLSGYNVAREVAVVPIARRFSGKFIVYLMLSPYFWDHIQNNLRGIAYKGLNLGILRELPIPLPPLAEQHRIVAKVDTLMALCDRLEACLTAAAVTRRRLLDALLAEALAPSHDRAESATTERVATTTLVRAETTVEIEKERSALILTLAYERHRSARRDRTFGHVKAEKILHLVEVEADYDLGRAPVRDAAGPNDFPHLLATEKWAAEHRRFAFQKNGSGYNFKALPDFQKSLAIASDIDAATRARIEKIIDLFIPMDMGTAEVFATVYAAWNNLLIEGKTPTDDDIIRGAREEWHPQKLKIPRQKFAAALRHLKTSDFVPSGRGKFVHASKQQDLFLRQ